MKSRIEGTRASVVPAGRTGYRVGFPGTWCLANIRRRFATFHLKEGEVGKGGKMAGKRTGFSHLATALTRLFPHKSTQVVDFPHKAMARHFLDANLASQARHEMVAPVGCSLARNVVTNERELGKAKMNRRDAESRGGRRRDGQ